MKEESWIRFWTWISRIVIVGLFISAIQLAWWLFIPYNIIEFKQFCYSEEKITSHCPDKIHDNKFEGIIMNPNKKVKRGDDLIIRLDFEKFYDIPTEKITRQLVNDRYVTLSCDEGGSLPKGKHVIDLSIKIPENIFAARYRLLNFIEYHPNRFRIIHEFWKTEWFEVTP